MASEDEKWECEAECIEERELSLHMKLETGELVWVPRSLLHEDNEVDNEGEEGTLAVQYWWAEQEGLV